jgi:hypothetical protein
MSEHDEFVARAKERGMGVAVKVYYLTPDEKGCHKSKAEHVAAELGIELKK